jgi:D-2-hydroxyacid dehydrogenase (NADP+)
MKILVHFEFFEADQIEHMAAIARDNGGHELVHAVTDEEALRHASQAEVILGHIKKAVCGAATNLRWIQSNSAGMDSFLFPEIAQREEVLVTNMAGLYASQGGEHVWALLLGLARGVPQAVESKAVGKWGGISHDPIELAGGTLGIIGMGGFGIETATRAAGYDMTVIALDPMRTQAPDGVSELRVPTADNLIDLLKRSDAVVLCCPRTKQTYHLIGAVELEAMKPTAYLINVTRGGIIDEDALAQALTDGQIAGAGLDVTETEPLPAESPLWSAPNVIITPHRAGASQHRPRKTYEFFAAQLERYLTGKTLLNQVDKKAGY